MNFDNFRNTAPLKSKLTEGEPNGYPLAWSRISNGSTEKIDRQRAKKVGSDSPGLVDLAIGLVFFVLNLPDVQVLFFGEIQITEGLLSILLIKKGLGATRNDLWASTCYRQLARMAGCKTDFLCTLKGRSKD